jgi:hypothetical protein
MTTHYVLVAIDTPGLDEPELVAEMISEILEGDPLLYMIGSSGGPNPPYERHGEILSVTPETLG